LASPAQVKIFKDHNSRHRLQQP